MPTFFFLTLFLDPPMTVVEDKIPGDGQDTPKSEIGIIRVKGVSYYQTRVHRQGLGSTTPRSEPGKSGSPELTRPKRVSTTRSVPWLFTPTGNPITLFRCLSPLSPPSQFPLHRP